MPSWAFSQSKCATIALSSYFCSSAAMPNVARTRESGPSAPTSRSPSSVAPPSSSMRAWSAWALRLRAAAPRCTRIDGRDAIALEAGQHAVALDDPGERFAHGRRE
jgi:hypothetical protein